MAPGLFDRNLRTTTEYWNDWAQSSPYSPYNLRHLPQPVPNDLPIDVAAGDGHLFGFEDAFEDLLAAASDQPLMDLRKHAEYKRIVVRAFRHGEEPTLFWANRLVNRGLLQNPLPAADLHLASRRPEVATAQSEEQTAAQRPRSVEQWFDERRRQAAELELQEARRQQDLFEQRRNGLFGQFDKKFTFNPADFVRQMEQMAQELKKEVCQADLEEWKKETMKKLDKDFTFNIADIFREVKQVAEDFKKDISEMVDLDAFLRTDDDKNPQKKQQPASEDDLFSAIESAVAEADTSFRNLAKAMTHDTRKNEDAAYWAGSQTGQPTQTEVVAHEESHGTTVRSTTQHVDMFGYVHQKTEIKTLDKDGNEISRESRYSVHPCSDKENQASPQAGQIESPGVVRQDGKDEKDKSADTASKPSGWFWR